MQWAWLITASFCNRSQLAHAGPSSIFMGAEITASIKDWFGLEAHISAQGPSARAVCGCSNEMLIHSPLNTKGPGLLRFHYRTQIGSQALLGKGIETLERPWAKTDRRKRWLIMTIKKFLSLYNTAALGAGFKSGMNNTGFAGNTVALSQFLLPL